MSTWGDDAPLGRVARGRRDRSAAAESDAVEAMPAVDARPGSRERPLTITQVVRGVRNVLERELGYDVWLEGETTSLSRPSSGHLYFALRDQNSQLRVVMWRSDAGRLRFRVEDGQVLRCRGRPTLYTRDGKFQFQINYAEPAGLGAEALALEQLKRRLDAEGLFDPAKKRPLPLLPRRIGVVTSKSGAAVRDIIRTVQRRFPVPILVADASVQGEVAPLEIARALDDIGRTDVDVVIVGRGGGAASDLAAFNSELVVRAVATCPVPVISAVGHEIDFSLTDLAADCRAATPTAAGELAVPVHAELAARLHKEERRLQREIEVAVQDARQELDQLAIRAQGVVERALANRRRELGELRSRLDAHHPRARLVAHRATLSRLEERVHNAGRRRIDAAATALTGLEDRVHGAGRRRIDDAGAALALLVARLQALSPLRVLERGYAIATGPGGVLTAADQVSVGDELGLRLGRGTLDCRVEAVHPAPAPQTPDQDDQS